MYRDAQLHRAGRDRSVDADLQPGARVSQDLETLRLPLPGERLRIVVLYDQKRREDHAVLLVSGANETLVLDNKRKRVIPWLELRERYKPYYSLNETSVWFHATKA